MNLDFLALDKNFSLIAILVCTNVQWRRKFFEPGSFSIEIPLDQYSPNMKYIYTKDRPEVGEISQINYISKNNTKRINLSGMFLENQVNKMVVYPKFTSGNIQNQPTWVKQSGKAETVAYAFYDAFKEIEVPGKTFGLDFLVATDQERGNQVNRQRIANSLGNALNSILKSSMMSYRINYDFESNTREFEVYKGVDRRLFSDAANDNALLFSTAAGNIVDPDILWSDTDYKNASISEIAYQDNGTDVSHILVNIGDEDETKLLYVKSTLNNQDYPTTQDLNDALISEAREALATKNKILSVKFKPILGSYVYREDFDLGDVCSIEIPEVKISYDAILSECTEVIKNGEWTLSMNFEEV